MIDKNMGYLLQDQDGTRVFVEVVDKIGDKIYYRPIYGLFSYNDGSYTPLKPVIHEMCKKQFLSQVVK